MTEPRNKLLIRETAGWSAEAAAAAPKIAALLAVADLPEPAPVPVVAYQSHGKLLIIGHAASAEAALQWADSLAGQLQVIVLIASGGGSADLPLVRSYPVYSGGNVKIAGYLGAFDVTWEQANPIDLARDERFDLVLDLSAEPLIKLHQPPQGYFAPGRDPLEQAQAARELAQMIGEFEKPKFFVYKESICAHSRSEIVGCTKCIDVCSARAITSEVEENRVKVEPHLCMGCGGCAAVCPSGAMTYAYPRVADVGVRIKTLLKTYRDAGGQEPVLLFHNGSDGRELIARLARGGRGLPVNVIPLEAFHIASLGIDTLLGAIAYGAAQVVVVSTGSEAPEYLLSLKREMGYAQQILTALGYGDGHFRLIEAPDSAALEVAVWGLPAAPKAPPAAPFNLSNEKRTTLEFIFDHLSLHAPRPQEEIALTAGAPYGEVVVDKQKCTLCMACVGACPESALLDSKERPQLKFIERNCVQCGLCEKTCPEDAISLAPRLLLAKQAKSEVVLNEAEVFACIKCGKPFATRQMIDNMLGRLTSHSMFAEPGALERLKMCGDCRVIDLLQNAKHGSILDLK